MRRRSSSEKSPSRLMPRAAPNIPVSAERPGHERLPRRSCPASSPMEPSAAGRWKIRYSATSGLGGKGGDLVQSALFIAHIHLAMIIGTGTIGPIDLRGGLVQRADRRGDEILTPDGLEKCARQVAWLLGATLHANESGARAVGKTVLLSGRRGRREGAGKGFQAAA